MGSSRRTTAVGRKCQSWMRTLACRGRRDAPGKPRAGVCRIAHARVVPPAAGPVGPGQHASLSERLWTEKHRVSCGRAYIESPLRLHIHTCILIYLEKLMSLSAKFRFPLSGCLSGDWLGRLSVCDWSAERGI